MFIPFESLPAHSRIWIYQSDRKFSDTEVQEIETALHNFIESWSAHGQSLEASYLVKYTPATVDPVPLIVALKT